MIHRHVLIKLTDEHATEAGRAAVLAESRRVLPGLPGVRALVAAGPADDQAAASWDIALVVSFDSLQHVATYLPHPAHRSYVDDFLRPRMEFIKAWNFEV